MIIALFFHEEKKSSFEICKQVICHLEKQKIQVVAENEKAKALNIKPITSINENEIKYLISMGGDGTLLRVAHKYSHLNAAILGINLGNLGFMADIPQTDILPSLDDLISKKFTIENRLILEGVSQRNKTCFAANDIVFHRACNHSLIELSLSVDDMFLNTFFADGIIISTPNGSTAYSLSAGGPIVSPQLDAFVITPICPHTISNRPIVITDNHEIGVKYLSKNNHPIEVHADGLVHFEMNTNEHFKVKKSQKTFKLVKLKRHDYFSTLRTKLNWTGKIGLEI